MPYKNKEKQREYQRRYYRERSKLRLVTERKPCRHCGGEVSESAARAYNWLCDSCNSKKSKDFYDKNFRVGRHGRVGREKATHCSGCEVELTEENRGRDARCKVCYKEACRNVAMKRKYGITIDQYNEMWVAQKGCCAICGVHQNEKFDGKNLAVDHDHETDEVRGLLCTNCNTGIGQLQEDPEILLKAVDYLRGE